MKLVILTTNTLHHCYFANELGKRFRIDAVFVEDRTIVLPFELQHPYETLREDYEQRAWFKGNSADLFDLDHAQKFPSLNDGDAVNALAELQPDIVLVFGTGKLSSNVIGCCPKGILNLHGGDPERDRGLDAHLWAIYENRFDDLVTTLHRVNNELDDGELVAKAPIPLYSGMNLHELRRVNTELCLDLVGSALIEYKRCGSISSQPQRTRGRYHSFMPSELKSTCLQNFEQYTSQLP